MQSALLPRMAWTLAPSPCLHRRRVSHACATSASGDAPEHAIQIPNVPLHIMPYPGETLTLSVSESTVHALAAAATKNVPMRALIYQPTGRSEIGALLSVSGARPVSGGIVEVNVTAISRARCYLDGGDIVQAARLHDWFVWDIEARLKLSKAMCEAATIAAETRGLRLRVNEDTKGADAWARVYACAPPEGDMELTAAEWAATPQQTRETWCRRAELYSFALARFAGVQDLNDARLSEIWGCTDTLHRVSLAVELLNLARSEAAAKNSLKNAFDR